MEAKCIHDSREYVFSRIILYYLIFFLRFCVNEILQVFFLIRDLNEMNIIHQSDLRTCLFAFFNSSLTNI